MNLPKLCPKDCGHTTPQCMSDFFRHVPHDRDILMLHLPTRTVFEIIADENAPLLGGPFDGFAARLSYACEGGQQPDTAARLWCIAKGAILAFHRHPFSCAEKLNALPRSNHLVNAIPPCS